MDQLQSESSPNNETPNHIKSHFPIILTTATIAILLVICAWSIVRIINSWQEQHLTRSMIPSPTDSIPYVDYNKITESPTTVLSPTPTDIPYPVPDTHTWKSFTASSGISFKYPSNWTVKESTTQTGQTGFGPIDDVKVTSPNNLQLEYKNFIQGIGGACGLLCPIITVVKKEQVNIANYDTLSLVEVVFQDNKTKIITRVDVGLVGAEYTNGYDFGYFFNDKDPNKYLDEFTFSINIAAKGQLADFHQYFEDTEVKTGEDILSTFSF